MNRDLGKRLIEIKRRMMSKFTLENWEELGLLTGNSSIISGHPRLLRSLSFGDEDYGGNVLQVLQSIVDSNNSAAEAIESYLDENFTDDSTFISAKPAVAKITFAPNVFAIPDGSIETDLVAVMMPFSPDFGDVFTAINAACKSAKMRCLRADSIWEDSTFIQDIFALIYRAQVVVVDFTGRNANVMYETGIAHTLGKTVVPITQTNNDIPSNMSHHRALKYLANSEGLKSLTEQFSKRIVHVSPPWVSKS